MVDVEAEKRLVDEVVQGLVARAAAFRKTVDGWKIVAESFSRNDRQGGEYVGYHPREER